MEIVVANLLNFKKIRMKIETIVGFSE